MQPSAGEGGAVEGVAGDGDVVSADDAKGGRGGGE